MLLHAGGLALAAGSHGIQIKANGFDHRYTNGNGFNQSHATAEMTLDAGSAQNNQYAPPVSFPRVANVRIHYGSGAGPFGVADAREYGRGCYDLSNTYYESFRPLTFDLGGTAVATSSFRMAPNGVGGYVLVPGSNAFVSPSSASLGLGDDATSGPLALPFQLQHPGGATDVLYVGSNGMVFPTSAVTTDFRPTVSALLAGPQRWCPAWRDLNPSAAGTVHFDVDASGTAVYCTWLGVPNFGGTVPNRFQVAFFATGEVEYRYQTMDVTGGETIVGYTTGNGATDPGSIDISSQVALAYSTGTGGAALALRASARPLAGTTIGLATSNVPAGASFSAVLAAFAAVVPGLELSALGMPGCWQHVPLGGAVTLGIAFGSPVANVPFSLPAGTAWLGIGLFAQSVSFVPGANALGAVSSNGLQLLLGNV
jgi:hypothetical protein